MLYRMGALNQPSPIASLAAAAHPVAPSSTNSSLNSGPMSPANVAVSPAPVKRRALSINLISPEANVIPLATAKHEVSEAITKEKSERVVDFSATGTQLNFAALNAEATEDKTEAVPADGLVSLMSAIQRVFFGTVE
jgi:hypothetical protein